MEGEQPVEDGGTPSAERHGENWWRAYDEAMAAGAREYADVLERLSAQGLPAFFTQTGGMCAAIEVTLEADAYLLVTDAEDTLS